jgi:hypothetical protein
MRERSWAGVFEQPGDPPAGLFCAPGCPSVLAQKAQQALLVGLCQDFALPCRWRAGWLAM